MNLLDTSYSFFKAAVISSLALMLNATVPAEASPSPAKQREHSFISAVNKKWTGGFDGMRKRRMIRALVVYNRTHFFLDKGTKRGIANDVLVAFEKDLNRALKTTRSNYIQILFVPVRRDELLQALLEGRGDIAAANLTITPERKKLVDFSSPGLRNVRELVITGKGGPKIKTLDDLSGKAVYVRPSSSYFEHLTELNAEFKSRGLELVTIVPTPPQLEAEDLMEMANAGLIPITIVDSHLAEFWERFFDNMIVHHDIAVNTGGSIAWAFRKGSPKLKALIDGFIQRNAGSLTINSILQNYLKNTRWVARATSAQEMAKFSRTVDLFKKYGDLYRFEHLLLAAQGYQESRLDQGARSPVGAIGIMQVMPATALELGVGDITLLEPNIHAGTKYMRRIMDTYFSDAAFDDLNRNLFAFASYNAGPNRIARLRKAAAGRGLNPNVWFDNVEHIVAEKIGQEPVRYVSNIFKYYVAYKLAADQRAEYSMVKESVKDGFVQEKSDGFLERLYKYLGW